MSALPRHRNERPHAAAVTKRRTASAPAASPPERRGELGFDRLDGPRVLVCGLHGGACTSTIAHLLAWHAASASRAPILLCEAPAASGDQVAIGAPRSALSLETLALTLSADEEPQGEWWAEDSNLRVLATSPAAAINTVAGRELPDTLRSAGREHSLTVVDGGTVRHDSTRGLLGVATHVIWTLRLDASAGEQARAMLGSNLVPPLAAGQALAATAEPRSRQTRAVRELRRIAHTAGIRQLVVLPHASPAAARPIDLGRQPLRRPLLSLDRFLREP